MAAQTNPLPFPGKMEPADGELGPEPDIKSEHFEDSRSSSEEPAASSAVILDWDMMLADRENPCAGRSCASPSHGDLVTDLSGLDESPVQPILQSFPVSVISGKPRRFTAHWYSKYGAWLEYSVEKDAIFCKVCRHFGNSLIADKFTRGFRNWKRTHQACSKHELSKAHNTALGKYTNYKQGQQQQQSSRVPVLNQPGNHHTLTPGLIQSNRDHIRVMLDIVMFCVRQQHITAHCKHKENDPTDFQELFQLLCKYAPRIKNRIDAVPKTLMGQELQNDLMDAAASLLLRRIKQELHDTTKTYYAILAERCSDQTGRHLVAVCLRYLYRGSLRERVVGFVDTRHGDMADEEMALKIVQIFEPFELDPGLCVGFSFDGASVTSGVEIILKRTFIRALHVNCHSHRLNSVLCDASKACADFKTFFRTVHGLCLFLTHSTRGQARFLEIQKEMHPDRPPLELDCGAQTNLSSVTDMYSLFDVVLEMLSEFAENGGQAGLEAQSLLQQVQTRKFTFFLVASCKLFEVSDFASKGLQSETLSLTECIDAVECLKQNLVDLRHSGFDQILTASNELTEKNEIENWDVSFSRKRKLSSRDDSAGSAPFPKSTRVRCADDLRSLWYQILDSQISKLDSRFHRDSYSLMKAAAALQTNDEGDLAENIHSVSKSYSIDVSDAELFTFSQIFQQSSSSAASSPPCLSLIEVFDSCSKENFPNLRLLIQILLTLPITACPDHRIYSSLNKIKSVSRSTTLTAQLNPLSLLSFEKDLTDSLDYDEIIDIFYLIKFIKPFISQGGQVESANHPSLTWKPMIPV